MRDHIAPTLLKIVLVILVTILIMVLVLPGLLNYNQKDLIDPTTQYGEETTKARVIAVNEQGTVTLGNVEQIYQVLDIKVLSGEYEGKVYRVDYGRQQVLAGNYPLKPGDTIYVSIGVRPDTGETRAFFTDFDRTQPILILFLVFLFFSILISGWKGVRSAIGIAFSMLMIVFYIIPGILAGKDPVFVSIVGAFLFLAISQYLVYGWTLKTHAAVIGILLSLMITGLLSVIFINFTKLTGFGDENVLFLAQMTQNINMRGLLLAGMLIGSLGVLDDLVISQASAVFELHATNSALSQRFLYKRAMNIGKDHVAATVNTLVLAYAGASLPMLLLFTISNQNPAVLINLSYIAEEIVRTLVGSIGLFLSVPLTTALATVIATNHSKIPWITKYFGPDNQWNEIGHHH